MKEIKFNKANKDWDAYLDGEYVGSYKSPRAAESELDKLRYEQLKHEAYVSKLETMRGSV